MSNPVFLSPQQKKSKWYNQSNYSSRQEAIAIKATQTPKDPLLLKRLWLLPLGLMAAVTAQLMESHPQWAETYSRTLYPKLHAVVGFLPAQVGFSVAEVLVGLFFFGCLALVGHYLRQLVQKKVTLQRFFYRLVTAAVAIFCGVYASFMLLCGPNYARQTFAQQAGYQLTPVTTAELTHLCETLAQELATAKAQLPEDTTWDFAHYAQEAVSALEKLGQEYPVLATVTYTAPKPVALSEVLSYADIGGIFMPFTMESNVNAHVPSYTIPATMVHELAHQAGFMREDEANYLAYRACIASSDPLLRYSGLSLAFSYSLSALNQTAPAQAARIKARLPQAVVEDRHSNQRYWQAHEGPFATWSNRLNDLYLKANRQQDGVASYNRMVLLLAAEHRKN